VVTAHGGGAVKREIAGSIDHQARGDPDGINRGTAGVSIMGGRWGGWGVLRKDSILETQRREFSSNPTRSYISIIINAQHNIIPSFQRGGDNRKEISVKDGTWIGVEYTPELKVPEVLVPDRAQGGRIPAGPVGREEGDRGAMLALEPDEGPAPKSGGVTTMSCFMA
jgi:hypothetical protein